MSIEMHVADTGTVFVATIMDGDDVVNVSAATTKNLLFRSPTGTVSTKAASFTTDGSDGKIQYTSLVTDFIVVGEWTVQASIVMPTGSWKSDIATFQVLSNLS